ncbi:MAG: ATP-dependent DNA helicase RecG, partial [Clostridia bacterium]|nr:ATP-dependent DNA helicase RecG [Clostridia bacterium]
IESFETSEKGLVPIYPSTKGLRQKELRQLIKNAIEYAKEHKLFLELTKEGMSIYDAVYQMHFPKDEKTLQKALERMKTDEAIYLSCAFDLLVPITKAKALEYSEKDFDEFCNKLPFEMTEGQKNAAKTIAADMTGQRGMNRLLQGNVGCGKTVVAIFALYLCCKNGFQAAFMSPTEVLAMQNYNAVKKYLPDINSAFLASSVKGAERKRILSGLKSGEIQLAVGTHALIQDEVEFNNLNLVVTDEQHRFGVKQRARLSKEACHTLIMSATPIPRTLALVSFKKLDISIISEMPKGRETISTHLVYPEKREDMYSYLAQQCEKGEQAYIVCPLIEKSESIEAKSVKEIYEELKKGALKNTTTALLHGRMKAEEKESILSDFKAGNISVLVSTTVIEVGVDVPNATIMIIENSDRFGLAALHQLRGRVGRGNKKSYCFAVTYKPESIERLDAFKQTNDGYKIAVMDLSMRGMGELTGISQHGGNVLKYIDLQNDGEVLQRAEEYIEAVKSKPYYNEIKKATLQMYDNILEDVILN